MRKVCFVTGTRAEFGLMESTLRAIRDHPALSLQVVATGMHTIGSRGSTVEVIRAAGFEVDRVLKWAGGASPMTTAAATGEALAALAKTYRRLNSDIVLVTGDRVEAFAAAAAAHISGLPVAHVHGGDRALGQVDDSLRHAITKLSHIHFAATKQSAQRIAKLGEDRWRIHQVGAPGIDGIRTAAASEGALRRAFANLDPRKFALLILHPVDASATLESRRARIVLEATLRAGIEQIMIVWPNNDPGAQGIVDCWRRARSPRVMVQANLGRGLFLGLLRECAVLVGNSSAGIIEAASFGTPVVDIGPRQSGREHGGNVVHVPYSGKAIGEAIAAFWRAGRPVRFPRRNPYGGEGAGRRIAQSLAALQIDHRLLRKLIVY